MGIPTGNTVRPGRELSIPVLFPAMSRSRRRRAMEKMEALENRLHFSVTQDANGWTVVNNPGTKIYVSSTGLDSNSGTSMNSPVLTFKHAQALAASDNANAILLKTGDLFHDAFTNWTLSGQSAAAPFVLGAYTPAGDLSTARPLIYTGTSGTGFSTQFYSANGATVNYLDVLDLQFDANLRDPTLGTVSMSPTPAGGAVGFEFEANGGNVLVEGCSFTYYGQENIYIAATTNPNSPFQSPSVTNITIRRTEDSYAYAFNGGRSQGLYAYTVNGLTIDQCIFDHDGWNENLYLGAEDLGYNHDIYIASTCSNFSCQGSILAEASFAGINGRAGGNIDNNIFIDDPVACTFGAADGADSTIGGVSGSLIGNTVVGDRASQTITYSKTANSGKGGYVVGAGLAFGQGFVLANTKPGANVNVSSNIFTQDSQHAKPAIQLEVPTGTTNPSKAVGINDLTISNNIIYGTNTTGWRTGLQLNGNFVDGGTGLYALNNLKVSGNAYINCSTVEVRHDSAYSSAQEHWSADFFYDTALAQSNWVTLQSKSLTFSTWQNTYDPGTKIYTTLPYTNPNVTVGTYDTTVGGPGTWQDFLVQANQLSITNYRTQFMAMAAVTYIQQGFNVASTFTNGTPNTPPTATAVTTNITASINPTSTYTFTVNYTDGALLSTTSLTSTNLLVDGPNGYSQYATYIAAATPTVDGSGYQHTAVTYSVPAPLGGWVPTANGTYTIDVLPNQVSDSLGNFVPDSIIGTFSADVTPPAVAAVAANLTSSSASATSTSFTVTYTDSAGIDTSTLNNFQVRVTGPNGYSSNASIATNGISTGSNGAVTVTYNLPAPGGSWSVAANGTYTISLASNSVYDLAGNAATGGTLTTFNANLSTGINTTVGSASIAGIAFVDGTGNGIYNARDNALTGVTIFIDLTGTGVLAGGDPQTITDVNGNYSFSNLSAGQYTVIEVAPSGFAVTSPVAGNNVVTLSTTTAATNINFANQTGNFVVNGNAGIGSTTSGSTTTNTGTNSGLQPIDNNRRH